MIYLVRHGETALNVKRVLQGRSNYPLTDRGEEQAREVADWFRSQGIVFDRVYSSPLTRALQTARIIVGDEMEIVPEQRLIETDYGPYEGCSLSDPAPELRYFFEDFINHPAPEGMEQLSEVVERAGAFLEDIKVLQGTPIVMLLMILYYIIFGKTSVSAFWVCVLGFSLDFSAYASEIFRSGIEAVPSGQFRAAKALGFKPVDAFLRVVLPQSMLYIVPVYIGQLISTVKLTSVAGYISVEDLTRASDIIRSRTYEAFFPLVVTAIIYFLVALLLTRLLKIAQHRVDPMSRPRTVKGVEMHDQG